MSVRRVAYLRAATGYPRQLLSTAIHAGFCHSGTTSGRGLLLTEQWLLGLTRRLGGVYFTALAAGPPIGETLASERFDVGLP